MKKIIKFGFYATIIFVAVFSVYSLVNAQTSVICPIGYTCTPIAQQLNCPVGYVCTPTIPSVKPPVRANDSCYLFTQNLTIGSMGPDVVALQTWLIGSGFDIPAISKGQTPKGYLGYATAFALRAYQVSVGLLGTGYFGPLERAKINASCSSPKSIIKSIVSSTVPSITVLSPKQGGVYDNGSTQNINVQWNSQDIIADYYYVDLGNISTGNTSINLKDNVSINSNGISFQPTENIINSVIANSGGKTKEQTKDGYYVIVVALKKLSNGYNTEVARGKSGIFTINPLIYTPPTTQPPITILSPNGGENFAQGESLNVIWNSSSPTQPVDVKILNSNNQVLPNPFQANVKPSNSNAQSIGFTTSPSIIPLGQYKARVCSAGTDNCDDSDAVFNIISPVINVQPVINQITPQPVSVGSSLTVNVTNAGRSGNIILTTSDGLKTWSTGYATDIRTLNGFSLYDGSKLSFTIPSTIGRGVHPDSWWNEPTVPITSGIYKLYMGASDANNTFIKSNVIDVSITSPTPTPTVPTITSISPTSGPAGIVVTITGTNFTSIGNVIEFNTGTGGTSFTSNSSDGKTLKFTAPNYTYGDYKISVSNDTYSFGPVFGTPFKLTAPPLQTSYISPMDLNASIWDAIGEYFKIKRD
ncbi:MAG: IPT/TIG domain-containing protein [Patescibacteria group bacterium]